MSILILSNGAPNYHRFFNRLGDRFKADGEEVLYAVDSPYSRTINRLAETGCRVHEFSSYFRTHVIDRAILERYATYNLNYALLSDFERAEVYGVWDGGRSNEFFDKLKSALLSFFERILLDRQVSHIYYENVSNTFAYFAFIVSRQLSRVYRGLVVSRLPGRYAVTDDPFSDHLPIQARCEKIYRGEELPPPDVIEWVRNYIDNLSTSTPDYMKFNKLDDHRVWSRYLRREKLRKIGDGVRHAGDDHYHAFQIGNPLRFSLQMFKRTLARRLRIPTLNKLYGHVIDEPFYLYPLHFHPESSTSILAGGYLDEYEVIRNLAFNLPEGARLYVKDHLSAQGYQSLAFYRKLVALPNVTLLHPGAPTKELIKKSIAVITLTSTVGYEAVLLKKPVYLLGHVFYKFHPLVTQLDSPSYIHNILSRGQEWPLTTEELDRYNSSFVASYFLNTYPGILNYNQEDSALEPLVEMVYASMREA
ncbi:hypothetical protein [Phytopseudomonas dryadis]|uniref:Capsular biosynthesis protein n=1 Tax=Phytopseudomonas dryadis TaxID=2487520 RepID=A0A4Q9QTH7_9GAMM|nr:hypothetical protein [Pseudomonas dryadis]TBU86363.1 hypothetical protein DNK44_23195 [Pseudomonas dryadis]